mgnify:CR=1 FL=1
MDGSQWADFISEWNKEETPTSYGGNLWLGLWNAMMEDKASIAPIYEGQPGFFGYDEQGNPVTKFAVDDVVWNENEPGHTNQLAWGHNYMTQAFDRDAKNWNPFKSKFYRAGRGGFEGTDISTKPYAGYTGPTESQARANMQKMSGQKLNTLDYLSGLYNNNSEWAGMGYEEPDWIEDLIAEVQGIKKINS